MNESSIQPSGRRRSAHAVITSVNVSSTVISNRRIDRRSDRAASAQAALLDAALSRCRARLDQLRACEDLRVEGCDLAFAVIFE